MSTVLVVQPDAAQAETLERICHRIGAEFLIVQSASQAIDSVSRHIPDLILLSTLLSPRDESALMTHLRGLDAASHLQTLTIPQFRTGKEGEKSRGGLFRRKAKAQVEVGCDPAVFAEEVAMQLKIAEDIRSRPVVPRPAPPPAAASAPQATSAASVPAESGWKMNAWPDEPPRDVPAYEPPVYQSPVYESPLDELPILEPEPDPVPEPVARDLSPVTEQARGPQPISADEDEIDRLARQLGLNVRILGIDEEHAPPAPASSGDEGGLDLADALDRARLEADRRNLEAMRADTEAAEAIREAAIAEARATAEREAREALAADLARVQAEAEAMRERAIVEARAAAEQEAREKLDAELARVRAETEVTVAGALSAEREARERLDAELARVRAETEETVAQALSRVKQEAEDAERIRAEAQRAKADAERARAEAAAVAERLKAQAAEEAERARGEAERARAEAAAAAERLKAEAAAEAERARMESERMRAEAQESFAADLARVRAEVEKSLAEQLETARAEAERMRAAEAKAARERAAMEAQLKSEIDRLKFVATQTRKSDENETRRAAEQIRQLEEELARVHAKTEERQTAQLQELRAQMAEMREAAAKHARAAAAEAVKTEVARSTVPAAEGTRKLNVVRMKPRPAPAHPATMAAATAPVLLPIAESVKSQQPEPSVPPAAEQKEPPAADVSGRDYYSLWQPTPAPPPAEEPSEPVEERHIDFKRHAKWALPVAACLLLVTNTGTAISTVKRLVTPAETAPLTVQPLDVEKPFIEVVEQRVGQAKIESTPPGAEAIVDGKSYGPTPVTIPDLEVGPHTLVLKSSSGAISKQFTVKANQTSILSEAIFAGWLAIFAPFPVTVLIDGQAVSLTDDGRVMTTPGKHVVELVAERFSYRSSETLQVRPGETTAHTLIPPTGTVRVTAPEGIQIRVDGEPASGSPSEGLVVPIGSHEITGTHPQLGERRVSVDVRAGALTDVSLVFE